MFKWSVAMLVPARNCMACPPAGEYSNPGQFKRWFQLVFQIEE